MGTPEYLINHLELTGGVLADLGCAVPGEKAVLTAAADLSRNIDLSVANPERAWEYGFPALIDTKIGTISPEKWASVQPGRALACAFAGSNWIVSLVEKTPDGKLTLRELKKVKIPRDKRQHNPESFVRLMGDVIDTAASENNIEPSTIDAVGIALGFAQENYVTDDGIDARLTPEADAKGWHFHDFEGGGISIGRMLTANLRGRSEKQWHVRKFAFRNDTHGVAEDGQTWSEFTLPIGFVWGTGDNGAWDRVNLELGKQPLSVDPILRRMSELGLLPDSNKIIEYILGGDYIKHRVAVAMMLLEERGLVSQGKLIGDRLLKSTEDAVVSDIAEFGENGLGELAAELKFADTLPVLQKVCRTTLEQAGIWMGINMSVCASKAGYDGSGSAFIPVEGSVFWKGYGVREAAVRAMRQIEPDNRFIFREASGMRGVGAVALAQTVQ